MESAELIGSGAERERERKRRREREEERKKGAESIQGKSPQWPIKMRQEAKEKMNLRWKVELVLCCESCAVAVVWAKWLN